MYSILMYIFGELHPERALTKYRETKTVFNIYNIPSTCFAKKISYTLWCDGILGFRCTGIWDRLLYTPQKENKMILFCYTKLFMRRKNFFFSLDIHCCFGIKCPLMISKRFCVKFLYIVIKILFAAVLISELQLKIESLFGHFILHDEIKTFGIFDFESNRNVLWATFRKKCFKNAHQMHELGR